MRASEIASGLLERFTSELGSQNRRLFEAWPLARYIACLDAYPEIAKLGYRSRAVRRACAEIGGLVGEEGLERYHRALLVSLLIRASEALRGRNHPEEINLLYEENYQRIVADLESSMNRPGMYRYPLSPFCKDLGLCTLRLIPAGVQKVHAYRLPRRMFLSGGPGGGLYALRFAFLEQRGLGPYYEMHTHSQDVRAMRTFNPRGWSQFYLRVAELLRRNPRMKGVIGAAWFFDPVLADVSPGLAYLRLLVTDHGGRLFPLGPAGASGTQDAIAFATERRQLHAEGRYRPMSWLVVWPRRELLSWADTESASGPAPAAVPAPEALNRTEAG